MSSSSSTSIDKEIGEIQVALRKAHEIIYKLAMQMDNATTIVDNKLSVVDEDVRKVAREVSHIRDNTNTVTSIFPGRPTYLGFLLALDAVIWVLALFLLFKIVTNLRGVQKMSQKWQTKYATLRRTPRPAVIIAEDPVTKTVVVQSLPDTREVREPPPYRASLGRGHYRRQPPPPRYQDTEEASSLLNEIVPEKRREWSQIVNEL